MISAMTAMDSGSESTTTPSMSKITPRRRRAGAALATGVSAHGGPPVGGRLPEIVQYLVIVLLERRNDLQDERDGYRAGPVQCRQHPGGLDDPGRVRLRREGRMMIGGPVGLLELHDRRAASQAGQPRVGIAVRARRARDALVPHIEAEPDRDM